MATHGAATHGVAPLGSRSRPQARKKPSDDAAYPAPPSTATKRHAPDRADGEPRVKRKRVEPTAAHARRAGKAAADPDDDRSIVNFARLPVAALHRYLAHFGVVPAVHPPPLTAAHPPAPWRLLDPPASCSRALSPVAAALASRPRRDPKDQTHHVPGPTPAQNQSHAQNRRRSSRLLDDHEPRTPVLADVADVHAVLANIVSRHFQDHVVNEIDTLASFMVKTKWDHGHYPAHVV